VQLAREVDPGLQQPRAALLARRYADARGEGGGLAERPQVVPLGVCQLEASAAAVREDHAQPAPGSRHWHAAERLDAADPRVALRHPARQVAGHFDHAVLGQRHLGDRGLLERPVELGEEPGVQAVAAHDHHELARVVVEQQPGAVHRAQPAAGLAEPVVELAPRLGRAVERSQELDDHVERVRARREGLVHLLLYLFPRDGVTQA
jgi:hypothetical protein